MTEVEKAAIAYVDQHGRAGGSAFATQQAFLAGAAWQREQDAKIIMDLKISEPLTQIAARILGQYKQQEQNNDTIMALIDKHFPTQFPKRRN